MRSRRPSMRRPAAGETTTITSRSGTGALVGSATRLPPPATQRFWRATGSATRVPMPCRSPVDGVTGAALRGEVRLAPAPHHRRECRAAPAARREAHPAPALAPARCARTRRPPPHRLAARSTAGIRGTATLEDRQQALAPAVVQHHVRSKQVRAAHVAAAQVGAVARAAGRCRRRVSRARRPAGRPAGAAAPGTSAAAALGGVWTVPARRPRSTRQQDRRDDQSDDACGRPADGSMCMFPDLEYARATARQARDNTAPRRSTP